jgi:hypothetical protein
MPHHVRTWRGLLADRGCSLRQDIVLLLGTPIMATVLGMIKGNIAPPESQLHKAEKSMGSRKFAPDWINLATTRSDFGLSGHLHRVIGTFAERWTLPCLTG